MTKPPEPAEHGDLSNDELHRLIVVKEVVTKEDRGELGRAVDEYNARFTAEELSEMRADGEHPMDIRDAARVARNDERNVVSGAERWLRRSPEARGE